MPKLHPNRIAALSGALAAVAAALVTILGAVDTTAQAIVVSVALIAVGAVVVVFLLGSQRHEDRQEAGAWALSLDQEAPVVEDPEADDVPLEDLPSDEEELASPPPLHDGPGAQR